LDIELELLSERCEYLLTLGRHEKLRKSIRSLKEYNNWPGFIFEVNLAHQFEISGVIVRRDIEKLSGSNSNIDLVISNDFGYCANLELVSVQEPNGFTNRILARGSEGLMWGRHKQIDFLRRLQDKVCLKTTKNGLPHKFPSPKDGEYNLIAIEATNSLGIKPDRWDIILAAFGMEYVVPQFQLEILGLFEDWTQISGDLEPQYHQNKYVKERIHGILFLIDKDSHHNLVNKHYDCYFVKNPLLDINESEMKDIFNLSILGPLIQSNVSVLKVA
ncbi:MAG: hypothetical protein ABJA67_13805, partial [Chthonomonadales bacterium]